MEKICEHFNMFRIVSSKVGYKLINVGMFRTNAICLTNNRNNNEKTIEVRPSDLFLSIDFLKDEYTLLGCNLINSPHYGFMEALSKGEDIKKTDYIKRYIKGTLDGRYPHTASNIPFFCEKFETMKKKVESGDIAPISVYKVGEKYYIKDGKHRAALCAYYNKPIMCKILDNSSMVGTIGRIVAGLIGSNDDYSKHIELYNQLRTK